jgi:hypothetical protein
MANNNPSVPPDQLYQKTREDLLPFEDSRFNSLIQAVANYYTTRNDQSTWGNFLRALAQELAKLDYGYAYAVVNKNPQFLTPPDIRRRWNDPLYVSSNWPSKTQFDTDFKLMLIELIAAYRLGSTVVGIQDVIFAYTGINIQVQELYKEIGNGVFDQSDRNAIRVSVSVGNNSLSQITTLTQLQQIVQSLYGAIDLAKPAHVGLEFTTIFGEDEDIDCFISPAFLTQQQYVTLTPAQQSLYTLTAYVLTSPPVFWQASTPTSNPWSANTLLKDPNGNLQLSLNAGKPDVVMPTWNLTPGGHTHDNQITWLNISPAVTNLSLASNVVTVTASNFFAPGQQVKLVNLSASENFQFLNGQALSVLTANAIQFTAAFTHANVPSTPQTQGTVSYNPAATINLLTWAGLSPVLQGLYQQQYTNSNCSSSGIQDTLRIFIRQVEQPPQLPMLIQAPVLDPSNPTTTVSAYGRLLQQTLTAAQWAALPTIAFTINATAANGTEASYTFSALAGGVATPDLDLHEGMLVKIVGCTRAQFNVEARIRDVVMLTPTSGTFQIPLAATLPNVTELSASGSAWPHLQDAYQQVGGQYVLNQDASLPPLSDPSLNPPTRWIEVIGVHRATNTPLNVPTGEVANTDKTHPAGLVAPRLDQVWEIGGGDTDFILGLG